VDCEEAEMFHVTLLFTRPPNCLFPYLHLPFTSHLLYALVQ